MWRRDNCLRCQAIIVSAAPWMVRWRLLGGLIFTSCKEASDSEGSSEGLSKCCWKPKNFFLRMLTGSKSKGFLKRFEPISKISFIAANNNPTKKHTKHTVNTAHTMPTPTPFREHSFPFRKDSRSTSCRTVSLYPPIKRLQSRSQNTQCVHSSSQHSR